MSRERASLSRRQLLGSVGAVGALGGASGVGSWALFGDGETVAGSLAAGAVGVTLDCEDCTTASDGSVSFDFADLRPGDHGLETFTVTAEANPVRLWLRTNCPDPVDPLGDAVEVRLFHDGDCDGSALASSMYPEDGSWVALNEFRSTMRDGLRLDHRDGEPCHDGSLCLDLEYRLREDATWAEDLSTELSLEVVAEQCRHVSENEATWPFPSADCPELDCPDCVELGKLEVDDNLLLPDVYGFDELYAPFDDGRTYALEVLTATNKEEGDGSEETVCVAFRLLSGEDGEQLTEENAPPLCAVAVKGRNQTATYDVEPPSTRTRGQVCTTAQDGDSSPGDLPAISNIVVSVCDPEGGDDGDGCVSCPEDGDGSGDRITRTTFTYDGPDGVDARFEQQSTGETVTATRVDAGDSFTVDLNGSGKPDFDVDVDGTGLTVPAQSDPTALHTSCSQVYEVGMELVDERNTYTLTVESAVSKDGARLCGVSDR